MSHSTDGPRDFAATKEVYFDPDPANFPNYGGLYPDFPEIDRKFVSKGIWSGAEYSKFMHTAVELAQMDGDALRLKACKYLVIVLELNFTSFHDVTLVELILNHAVSLPC